MTTTVFVALLVSVATAQSPWGPDAPPPASPPPAPAPAPAPDSGSVGTGIWGTGTGQPLPLPEPSPPAAVPQLVPQTVDAAPEMADPGDAAVHAALVVQVSDRAAAVAKVVSAAEASGGWFAELSTDAVTVVVPRAQVRPLLVVAGSLGDVVDESFAREDLTARLADLRGTAASREKVLGRYLSVLEEASPKAVVSVEREITQLVSQLEGIRGQIKSLEDRSAYGVVEVSFRFRDRSAPVNEGTSSFAWINSLDASSVLADFQAGRRESRSAAVASVPDGFAAYGGAGRFQAISPEGVVYRVRSVRHTPAADLSFWREAVAERMVAAGYALVDERTVAPASGSPGAVFQFSAANGERDLTYLLGVFVGRRLVLVEAVGDAELTRGHLSALYDALEKLRL